MRNKGDQKTIRVGVIGVGQIGKGHIEFYQKIPGAQVVAIADIDEHEMANVSQQFNIPHTFTDFRQLLKLEEIDAVDVCLHNNLHMPVTVAALEAGKHVYCEKPMAGSYFDAEKMYRTAKEVDRKLSIQLYILFTKEVKAAEAVVNDGFLGKIYHARAAGFRRRMRPYVDGYGKPPFVQKHIAGGGAVFDMGIYPMAIVLHIMKNPEVLRVSGKIYQETEMDPIRKEVSGYDVEEFGVGLVRMGGEITMELVEAWAIHLDQFDGTYIVGSEGGLRIDPFGIFRNLGDLELTTTTDLEAFDWRIHAIRENSDKYDSPQHHWIAALQGRVELLPTAEIALNAMLISEGIYLSDELGREVTAEEIKENSQSLSLDI
jgi:predicted dehydrogenase